MKRGTIPLIISFLLGIVYLILSFAMLQETLSTISFQVVGIDVVVPALIFAPQVIMVLLAVFVNLCAIICGMSSLAMGAGVLYAVAIGFLPADFLYIILEFLLCLLAAQRMQDKKVENVITREEFISTLNFYRQQDMKRAEASSNITADESDADHQDKSNGQHEIQTPHSTISKEEARKRLDAMIKASEVQRESTKNTQGGGRAALAVILVLAVAAVAISLVTLQPWKKQAGSTEQTVSTGLNVSSTPSSTSAIPDLTGAWYMEDQESGLAFSAEIGSNTITVNWIADDETQALYWAGSFIAPTTSEIPYKWVSINDTSKTEYAMFASTDETKEFTYNGATISFSASAMGVTRNVKLEKQD